LEDGIPQPRLLSAKAPKVDDNPDLGSV